MNKRLFVHIGAPKTGTSYVQSLLWAGRAEFKSLGVSLPGKGQKAHFAAGSDLAGDPGDDYIEQVRRGRRAGAWDQFAQRIRRSDAPVVIFTDERLARSNEAPQRLAALGDVRSIHVIYTVRALDMILPSAWQTYVKHGAKHTFDEWLDIVLGDDSDAAPFRHFWSSHDPGAVLERWRVAYKDPGHAHIITVPRRATDPTILWRRFAEIVGLPAEPPAAEARPNEALDHAQVEALRRLNTRLGEALPPGARRRVVRNMLATKVMGGLSDGHRAVLPASRRPAVAERTAALLGGLSAGGYDIVGDLGELAVDSDAPDQPSPSEAAVAEATESTLAALVRRLARES